MCNPELAGLTFHCSDALAYSADSTPSPPPKSFGFRSVGMAVEISRSKAKQESKMEITLKKITNEWLNVEFEFEAHKGDPEVQLMKLPDDKVEMLEEHQVQVQNMFASRFLSTFESEALFGRVWVVDSSRLYYYCSLHITIGAHLRHSEVEPVQ